GGGADAEREREGGYDRERRMLAQHPGAVAKILREIVDRGPGRQGADVFGDARPVAEGAPRGERRVLGAEPAFALLFGFELEMRAQFTIEIVVAHVCSRSAKALRSHQRSAERLALRGRTAERLALDVGSGCGAHHARDGFLQPFPFRLRGGQLLTPGRRETVVLALAVVLAVRVPLR